MSASRIQEILKPVMSQKKEKKSVLSAGPGEGKEVEQCVDHARKGSEEAFGRLIEIFAPRLQAMIYRMILDWDETRDVSQETFVSAYEALPRFDGPGKFQSWLFRIGARKALDVIRRRKRHPEARVAASEKEIEHIAERGEADPAVEHHELAAAIEQAVGELPADQRTAFVLSEYEDWSSRDIAGVIGGSEKRVETQLYRARAFLREKLQKFL